MSKDIRSFFSVISKSLNKPKTPIIQKKNITKKILISSSSDEDVVDSTPDDKRKKITKTKNLQKSLHTTNQAKRCKTSGDERNIDSEENVKSKSVSKDKLKLVDIKDIFNNVPVSQSKVEIPEGKTNSKDERKIKKSRSKKKVEKPTIEIGIHDDEAFEKSLLELDLDLVMSNANLLGETFEAAKDEVQSKKYGAKEIENILEQPVAIRRSLKKFGAKKIENILEQPVAIKRSITPSKEDKPSKKIKLEHADSGIDSGQEAHEKKIYKAMSYQKYLNRSGPKHAGSKELPKGKPDCLKNICFLRTGVLDSLDSEAFDTIIKEHGGRTVHSVSKKVNYIVVGEEPGPAKLQKAESYNIPNITEDELLDLIRVKSGMDKKYTVVLNKHNSGDNGFASDFSNYENTENLIEVSDVTDKYIVKKVEVIKKTKNVEFIESDTKCENDTNKIVQNKPENIADDHYKENRKETTQFLSLTDKYQPTDVKGIIGQQSDESNMNKLKKWLSNWHSNRKKPLIKPSPWAKSSDGGYFKCALLSGAPGVGKTTTATLVAKSLGLDIVEFNASDTRSKKLLHEEVSQLLSTTTIAGFASGNATTDKKRVLLMDEVDGMAGNEDRGGMQELINLIKTSSVPIICMCNDRSHQKIRSLANYCYDLRFSKPKPKQILGFVMSICCKEGIQMAPNVVTEIINGTGCDIRQTLNHLTLLSASCKDLTVEQAHSEAVSAKKDTVLGPWEVCRATFSESEHKDMSFMDKSKLFFYDYSLGPLFVQENYLKVQPHVHKKQFLERASAAADAISMGDLIDSKIRSSNNWSLLDTQAAYSSVLPGFYMSGHFIKQIDFPGWLGKNSKKTKFKRILGEIHMHTRVKTSGNKLAIKLDYVKPLLQAILVPLKKEGLNGVPKAVSVMKSYGLLREDLDSLLTLSTWLRQKSLMTDIETKVKTAFTKTYNKEVPLSTRATASALSKKKTREGMSNDDDEDDDVDDAETDEDNVTNDALIKVNKKKPEKKKKNESEAKPSTSKKSRAKKK